MRNPAKRCTNTVMSKTDLPQTDILCIGSVLWDIIGRTDRSMRVGSDVPGRIVRVPGGVAMNIAMALARFGLTPDLLTAIGRDPAGEELIDAAAVRGIGTAHVYRSEDLPTDAYMAVEGANGLIAAIADAHSLEAAGDKILRPLRDGRLGSAEAPYSGRIALDGNLTTQLLREIAVSPFFAEADLRVAPASPGKAERLLPLLNHPRATLYVNLEEATILGHASYASSSEAAQALIGKGAHRVLVTDGGKDATMARDGLTLTHTPPEVLVARVTGAGDTFMAAHIAAEVNGASEEEALINALDAAALYVSGDTPL
ncbi:Sugar or nucleoside kinase, ribokinase family [Celeribacter neptunius]|uniref:Sugar or nucleoside kinase, ribokinase family n=2 Tax=Celeribacter neptunius TaxID=588602 RepID=A0A1I3L858_9RHOB|nr:Sugar or nucleoside kinase, ribokinase family [Celeribacter neptunius]